MLLSVSRPVRSKVYLSTNVPDPAIGITFIYEISQEHTLVRPFGAYLFVIPTFSISIALNVLLTLLIVGRTALLNNNIRDVMKAPVKVGRLYNAIVTSLVESCALYSVACILYIISWTAGDPFSGVSFPILVQIQVRFSPTHQGVV